MQVPTLLSNLLGAVRCRHIPLISVFRKLRQEICELEASLGYILRSYLNSLSLPPSKCMTHGAIFPAPKSVTFLRTWRIATLWGFTMYPIIFIIQREQDCHSVWAPDPFSQHWLTLRLDYVRCSISSPQLASTQKHSRLFDAVVTFLRGMCYDLDSECPFP